MRSVCSFLVALATAIPVLAQNTISGSWNGAVTIQERTLRFVLYVRGANEKLSATADSPDECRYGIPVERITLEGEKLHFTIAKSKVHFDGTFSDGSISGVFKQHKASAPLTLSKSEAGGEAANPDIRAPACVAGTWKGLIAFPWGTRLHMVLHVNGSNEKLSATADSPDQGVYGDRLDSITLTDQNLDFTITKYGVDFAGTFSGENISGTFGQYGIKVPLKFERLDGAIADQKESEREAQFLKESAQKNDAEAHPYLEEPLEQLITRIPELKGICPAANGEALAMILRKTGAGVDEFFDNVVGLVAQEQIKQERIGGVGGSRSVRDSYLILRHGNSTQADFDEFRMDANGNRLDQISLTDGFLVTSGFGLMCMHFSTALQWDSRFLYLGDQRVGVRDTHVVAFAQLPGEATLKVTLRGARGGEAHMLTQGIAWIDKESFHIVRMRSDLLAPQPEIGLEEQTTKVDFSEVKLRDVPAPLWLPRDVNVYVKIRQFLPGRSDEKFRNVHHYTDYRRYRVSAKIVAPQ
jgi:hypothetical protein